LAQQIGATRRPTSPPRPIHPNFFDFGFSLYFFNTPTQDDKNISIKLLVLSKTS
jgi:hypothetical protein